MNVAPLEGTLVTRSGRTLAWRPVGDVEAAAALMLASWSENPDTSLDYAPAVLRDFMTYPGEGPVVAPGLWDGDQLVAFVVGLPRTVLLRGVPRRLVLMTFFTVAPAWKGQGLGVQVWAECLRQARAAGYHGAFHYCADGNVSNLATQAGARAAGHVAEPVGTVRFLLGLLRRRGERSAATERPLAAVDDFLAASAGVESLVDLARRWTPAEARWQCGARRDAWCVTTRGDGGAGAVTAYTLPLRDARRTRCLFVEDVLWAPLDAARRDALLAELLAAAAAEAEIATVPDLGYADLTPFVRAGFRRSPRILHAYLTRFPNDVVEPVATPGSMDETGEPPVRSFYLDVF